MPYLDRLSVLADIAVGHLDKSAPTEQSSPYLDELASRAESKIQSLSVKEWITLLTERPEVLTKEGLNLTVPTQLWHTILEREPGLVHLADFSDFNNYEWVDLLRNNSGFLPLLDTKTLDIGQWASILERQPTYINQAPTDSFSGKVWLRLLIAQPFTMQDHANFDLLTGVQWSRLLQEQPDFEDVADFSLFSGQDWEDLLKVHLHFVNELKFTMLSEANWMEIYTHYKPPSIIKAKTSKQLAMSNFAGILRDDETLDKG